MAVNTAQRYVTMKTRHGTLLVRYVSLNGQEGVLLRAVCLKKNVVPVRVQSSCLFSESLGTTDCDCAAQLSRSLQVAVQEGGLVVYSYEEGRGAGLRTKLKAIALQARERIDTAEAYSRLGLPKDLRKYELGAKAIAEELGTGHVVELLTNNPNKAEMLAQQGIPIHSTRRLVCADTESVREYLHEKVRVLGHQLGTHMNDAE